MRAKVILLSLGLAAWLTIAHSQTVNGRRSANIAGYDLLANSHSDIVLRADVPLYPQLAIQARLSGVVHLRVFVDNGVVSKAEPDSSKAVQPLTMAAIKNVKTWRFAPGVKGLFNVTYTYEMEKREVPKFVNPVIVMNLPTSVKITEWPIKRYCLDCGSGSFRKQD